jgi:hypothetical protein
MYSMYASPHLPIRSNWPTHKHTETERSATSRSNSKESIDYLANKSCLCLINQIISLCAKLKVTFGRLFYVNLIRNLRSAVQQSLFIVEWEMCAQMTDSFLFQAFNFISLAVGHFNYFPLILYVRCPL